MLVAFLLLCVAVIVLAAIAAPKPAGWVALALAVAALLAAILVPHVAVHF